MKPDDQTCHFLTIKENDAHRTIHLTSLTYSLGRSSKSTIILPSSSISREHALLLRMPCPDPGRHTFRLLDGNASGKASLNGFTVNGEKKSMHDLEDGDLIVFGGAIEVTYSTRPAHECALEDVKATIANAGEYDEIFTAISADTKLELAASMSC